jgi:hypothetical protein
MIIGIDKFYIVGYDLDHLNRNNSFLVCIRGKAASSPCKGINIMEVETSADDEEIGLHPLEFSISFPLYLNEFFASAHKCL